MQLITNTEMKASSNSRVLKEEYEHDFPNRSGVHEISYLPNDVLLINFNCFCLITVQKTDLILKNEKNTQEKM